MEKPEDPARKAASLREVSEKLEEVEEELRGSFPAEQLMPGVLCEEVRTVLRASIREIPGYAASRSALLEARRRPSALAGEEFVARVDSGGRAVDYAFWRISVSGSAGRSGWDAYRLFDIYYVEPRFGERVSRRDFVGCERQHSLRDLYPHRMCSPEEIERGGRVSRGQPPLDEATGVARFYEAGEALDYAESLAHALADAGVDADPLPGISSYTDKRFLRGTFFDKTIPSGEEPPKLPDLHLGFLDPWDVELPPGRYKEVYEAVRSLRTAYMRKTEIADQLEEPGISEWRKESLREALEYTEEQAQSYASLIDGLSTEEARDALLLTVDKLEEERSAKDTYMKQLVRAEKLLSEREEQAERGRLAAQTRATGDEADDFPDVPF